MPSTSSSASTAVDEFLNKVIKNDFAKLPPVYCVNNKAEVITMTQNTSTVALVISTIQWLLCFILSPMRVIIFLLVFYADLPVPIPARMLIVCVLWYRDIVAKQATARALIRYQSASIDTVPHELYDANKDSSSNSNSSNQPSLQVSDTYVTNFASKRGATNTTITAFHRAGMRLCDCLIEVLDGTSHHHSYSATGGGSTGTASSSSIPMTFHIRITHKPSRCKWHVWRQFSDFIHTRNSIALDFMSTAGAASGGHAVGGQGDDDDSHAGEAAEISSQTHGVSLTGGGSGGSGMMSRLLTRTKTNSSIGHTTNSTKSRQHSSNSLGNGHSAHQRTNSNSAASKHANTAASALTTAAGGALPPMNGMSDAVGLLLPTLPLPLTHETALAAVEPTVLDSANDSEKRNSSHAVVVPVASAREVAAEAAMKQWIKRREVVVWGWLLQMQEIPSMAAHPFFREFLGMPPYDPSVTLPTAVSSSNALAPANTTTSPASKHKNWTGTSLTNFKFLDINPAYRYMFRSCKDSHGILVRGRTYKTDNKKINPGPAICELILLELYEVNTRKYPGMDRHDHIASKGRVKRRVEALAQLPDKPFIFVTNFQIPGDPPVSIVAYYALPSNWMEIHSNMENIQGFKKMLDRFIDMPRTEEERLAAWYGGPVHSKSASSSADATFSHSASTAATAESAAVHTSSTAATASGSVSASGVSKQRGIKAAETAATDAASCGGGTGGSDMLVRCFGGSSDSPQAAAPHHRDRSDMQESGLDLSDDEAAAAVSPGSTTSTVKHGQSALHTPAVAASASSASSQVVDEEASLTSFVRKSEHQQSKPANDGFFRRLMGGQNGKTPSKAPSSTQKTQQHSVVTAVAADPAKLLSSSSSSSSSTAATAGTSSTPATTPTGGDTAVKSAEFPLKVSIPQHSSVPATAPAAAAGTAARSGMSQNAATGTGTGGGGGGGGGWGVKVPSDIAWPAPEDPGCLPQSDFRNQRFKLVPSITEGPWVVVAAVRSKPALLGQKVVQRYYRGDNYMEIDVHVGSSVIATQIVSVCRGYGKHFTCNIGIVIQGEDESELPERMLMCITQNKLDLDVRMQLDEDDD